MVSANVASQLNPKGGYVYPVGQWPELQGYVTHPTLPSTALAPYARLWNAQDEQIWIRPMVARPEAPGWFKYQTVPPGTTEVKRITFGAGVTGGSWAFGHHDVATDGIGWGESIEGIVRKIAGHPDFQPWHPVVTWNQATYSLDITFAYERRKMNIDDFFVINNLTGSGNTSVTVTNVTPGVGDFSDHDTSRGHYFWDIVTWDGTSWTGGSWGQRMALAPARAEFWIDSPPAITMVQPLDSTVVAEVDIAHTQPQFIWTVAPMDYAYLAEQSIVIVDHDAQFVIPIEGKERWVTRDQAVRDYVLPYGVFSGENGKKYDWAYSATKQSGVVTVLTGRIEVQQYLPPAPVVTSCVVNGDDSTGPVYATVTYTVDDDDLFLDVVFRVREAGTASRGADDVILGYRADPTVTSVNIVEYPFNTDMILSLSQRAMRNGKIVEGPPAEVPFRATWGGTMLTEVYSETIRSLPIPGHRGRSISGADSVDYADVLNRAQPIAIHSGIGKAYTGEIVAVLDGAFPEAPRAKWERIQSMYENLGKQTLLYRDALGGMKGMLYVQIDRPVLNVRGGGWPPEVTIPFTQIARDQLQLPTGPAT